MPDHFLPPHVDQLTIVQWRDPIVENSGYEMRGMYVERFWLPVLGPTSTFLLRRIAESFDTKPHGFDVDLADVGAQLGVAYTPSPQNALTRAFTRLALFGFAKHAIANGKECVAMRRVAPPLAQRHIKRLPASLVATLEAWNSSAQMPIRCANSSR